MVRRRTRGVRASRLKLERALAESNLEKKTQIALANAIADAEELDAAPRDLVSKLFRELPVDPQTIERVARILDVDAGSLYKQDQSDDADDEDNPHEGSANDLVANRTFSKKRRLVVGSVVGAFLTAALLYFLMPGHLTGRCSDGLVGAGLEAGDDKLGIVIGRFVGDPDNEVQLLLARSLASDDDLAPMLEVFRSCRTITLASGDSYRQEVQDAHRQAQRDLDATDSQLFIWGERFGERVSLRFATMRSPDGQMMLSLDGRDRAVQEIDFSQPIRLGDDRPFPPEIKRLALEILLARDPKRRELRQSALAIYDGSADWLRDGIASDRALLQSAQVRERPRLYFVTANQLCYRLRLLGDVESKLRHYEEAEKVCREALAKIDKQTSPSDFATIQLNMGTAIHRQHLFTNEQPEQIRLVMKARDAFQKALPAADRSLRPDDYSSVHRNLAISYLRLAEIDPSDANRKAGNLRSALDHGRKSLSVLDPASRPFEYAQASQNLCLIEHRLGASTGVVSWFDDAINNCREGTRTIDPETAPQQWAMAQNNLAIAHALRAEFSEDPVGLRQALREFAKSQDVYTLNQYPANWAEVEANKGELSCRLAILAQDKAPLRDARKHCEAALQVFADKGVGRYVDYVENLLGKISACERGPIVNCKCTDL